MKDKTLFMEGLLLALLAADITNVILANDNGCCESVRMEVDESKYQRQSSNTICLLPIIAI